MCCQPTIAAATRGFWSAPGGYCDCEGIPFSRRFQTAKERQEELEKYRDQLKNELKAVEERIHDLKEK